MLIRMAPLMKSLTHVQCPLDTTKLLEGTKNILMEAYALSRSSSVNNVVQIYLTQALPLRLEILRIGMYHYSIGMVPSKRHTEFVIRMLHATMKDCDLHELSYPLYNAARALNIRDVARDIQRRNNWR